MPYGELSNNRANGYQRANSHHYKPFYLDTNNNEWVSQNDQKAREITKANGGLRPTRHASTTVHRLFKSAATVDTFSALGL
jgi:hypothetical protein